MDKIIFTMQWEKSQIFERLFFRSGPYSKLQEGDLELIEVLKVHPPSISLSEIIQELQDPEISMSAISRAIKNKLPSHKQYVYKAKNIDRDLSRKTCSTHSVSSTVFH